MADKLWYLKRCRLLEQLPPEALTSLESRCLARSFPRKSPIYLPADPAQSVFLLASGRAKICHLTPDGKQSILAFIDPGELFGELALLETGTRDEYAEAVETTTVVLIPGDVMQDLMGRYSDFSLGITRMIGTRRQRIERRLKHLLFVPNRERLTHLLLDLAEQYGVAEAEGIRLSIRLSHQDLANLIGSTRETVTVMLGQMQSEGLVDIGRRRLVIRDLERLAQSIHATLPPASSDRPVSVPSRPGSRSSDGKPT